MVNEVTVELSTGEKVKMRQVSFWESIEANRQCRKPDGTVDLDDLGIKLLELSTDGVITEKRFKSKDMALNDGYVLREEVMNLNQIDPRFLARYGPAKAAIQESQSKPTSTESTSTTSLPTE